MSYLITAADSAKMRRPSPRTMESDASAFGSGIPTKPNTRLKQFVDCVVLLLVFAPALVSAQQVTALVLVAPVVRAEVFAQADFVATVHPVRRSIIGSAVDGRVIEFLSEGDNVSKKVTRVAKGESPAKLRTTTLEIDLASAQAELRIRQQQGS